MKLCLMISLLLRKSLKHLNQVICQKYAFNVNIQKKNLLSNRNYQWTCDCMHQAQASGVLSALVYAHASVLVSLSPKASPSKEKIWLAVRRWDWTTVRICAVRPQHVTLLLGELQTRNVTWNQNRMLVPTKVVLGITDGEMMKIGAGIGWLVMVCLTRFRIINIHFNIL